METFIWVAAFWWGTEAVLKVIQLGTGKIPPRIPFAIAVDAILNTVFVIWAATLLSGITN